MTTLAPTAADFHTIQAERQQLEKLLAAKRQRLAALPKERQAAQRALDYRGVLRVDNDLDDLQVELPKLEQQLAELVERERVAAGEWLHAQRESARAAAQQTYDGCWARAWSALL